MKPLSADEFKKIKPEYKDAEGDVLWDAMTEFMLRQQQGEMVIKTTLPFYKRYRLRWLFYQRLPNMVFGKDGYRARERCKNCKKGVGMEVGFMMPGKGAWSFCTNCHTELIKEPNISFAHKLWTCWSKIKKFTIFILDFLHILRSSISGRYDMFGDEANYVEYHSIDFNTGKTGYKLKARKWYEYIFIRK